MMKLRSVWLFLLWSVWVAPVAADEGISLQQIAQLKIVTQVSIAPNGREVAYLLSVPRIPGQGEDGPAHSELHLVDADGKSRLYVGHHLSPAAPAWSPNGEQVVFIGKREDDESRSLYRIPLAGGEARQWMSLPGDIRSFDQSPDGKQVALLSTPPEDEDLKAQRKQGFTQKIVEEDWQPVQLYIAATDVATDDAGKKDREPRHVKLEGSVHQVLWSPAGDRLAVKVAPTPSIDDFFMFTRIVIIDLEGKVLGRVDTPGKLGDMAWSPDGRHLALIATEDIHDPREGRLMVVGRDGGQPRNLLPDLKGHVWQLGWRDERRIVYVSHESTATRLAEIARDGSGQRDLLDGNKVIWTGLQVSAAGDLALLGNAPQHPNEVYRLGRDQRQAQRLTDSNPWLAEVRLARQEVVRYAARDGLEIEGILFHPMQRDGDARVPLILVVHGGPEAHYSNGWLSWYHQPAQYAAARGYAVFLPNYRASTGRGVAFSKANHGRPAREEFDDLVDGVDHLIELGLVDADRVGITGGSYGGYASAWGATYYSERFAAAVMNVGLSDKISMLGTTDIPQELYLVHYLTWPWEDWSLFVEASPIRYAQQSRTPTLILHGEADTRVEVSQSKTMYRYLQLAGQAPVRLVLYPGEGHGNVRAASRWDYSLRLMRWMDHYLMGEGGEPPPYPVDYQLDSFKE